MSNSPEVKNAIDEVIQKFVEMPSEEFKKLLEEQTQKMNRALLNGDPDLGFELWYAQEPETAMAYLDRLLKESK